MGAGPLGADAGTGLRSEQVLRHPAGDDQGQAAGQRHDDTGDDPADGVRFFRGDVEVVEVPGAYSFEVRFVGTLGIPANMAGLIQIMEEIKPAHLDYSFVYSYTWWDSLKSLTWNGAHSKTWNELRVYE